MPPAMLAALRPPPQLTVSQWADQHRILPSKGNAQAGPFRTALTPYMREIMDAGGDTAHTARVVFIKCARVGGTEAINNILAHSIDVLPRPALYLQPAREHVEEEFAGRIRQMIEACPRLAQHIPRASTGKPQQNWATNHRITLGPAVIYGAWATNPNTLIRRTIGLLVVDEVDNVATQSTRLGNFFKVAQERVVTYDDLALSTIFAPGTPTHQYAAGWRALEHSDFRKFHVPCPNCGAYQWLHLHGLVLHPRHAEILDGSHEPPTPGSFEFDHPPEVDNHPDNPDDTSAVQNSQKPAKPGVSANKKPDNQGNNTGDTSGGRPDGEKIEAHQLVRYRCKHCAALLDWRQHHRWMIDRGVWIPRGFVAAEPHPHAAETNQKKTHPVCTDSATLAIQPPGRVQWHPRLKPDPDYDGPPIPHTPDGQPLPPHRSRTRGYHLNVLYSPFASRTWSHILAEFFRVKDNPDDLRVFVNSWLAEPWRETAAELAPHELDFKRQSDAATLHKTVPTPARLLLMGVDVQLDHVWYVVRAFGPHGESWLIDAGKLYTTGGAPGSFGPHGEQVDAAPLKSDLQHAYELAFTRGYEYAGSGAENHPSGGLLRCRAMIIDSGANARRDEVNDWAQRPGVLLAKGQGAAQFNWSVAGGQPFRLSSNIKGLLLINTDALISRLHRLLRLPEDDPEAFHLATDTPDDYLEHLTNVVQVRDTVKGGKMKGRPIFVWRLKHDGSRVDLLDCEVYVQALALAMGIAGPGSTLRQHLPPTDFLIPPDPPTPGSPGTPGSHHSTTGAPSRRPPSPGTASPGPRTKPPHQPRRGPGPPGRGMMG